MEVEGMLVVVGHELACSSIVGSTEEIARTHVANAPGDSALLTRSGSLVGLALNAEIHDVVAANSAVVDNDIPSP